MWYYLLPIEYDTRKSFFQESDIRLHYVGNNRYFVKLFRNVNQRVQSCSYNMATNIFEAYFYEFVHVHGSNRVLPNGST